MDSSNWLLDRFISSLRGVTASYRHTSIQYILCISAMYSLFSKLGCWGHVAVPSCQNNADMSEWCWWCFIYIILTLHQKNITSSVYIVSPVSCHTAFSRGTSNFVPMIYTHLMCCGLISVKDVRNSISNIIHIKFEVSLNSLYQTPDSKHLQDVGDKYKCIREASKIWYCEFLTSWTDKSRCAAVIY